MTVSLRIGGRSDSVERRALRAAAERVGIRTEDIGELERAEVSKEMLNANVLLAPSPIFFVRKSSIVLSSRAHGLPVLLPRAEIEIGDEMPLPGVVPLDTEGRWIDAVGAAEHAPRYDPRLAARTTAEILLGAMDGRRRAFPREEQSKT
jgi:hypothetical protein